MKRNNWWMYFVQGEHSQNIKIGIATCPYRRVDTLQSNCTERLKILGIARITGTSEEEARDAEAQVHRRFESQRLHGEMFSPSLRLLKVANMKRVGSEHHCRRCASITSEPLVIVKQMKPVAVSISSKVRHKETRRAQNPDLPTLYHEKLPRMFFPRRDRDEYGGKVQHLRPGVSATAYSKRFATYKPPLG